MSSCNGNCSTCGSDCADRKAESLLANLNPKSSVKKVIAVVSGKGGVGKSTVTSMLAVAMARKGKRVGVLDADITGPSAPTAFGVTGDVPLTVFQSLPVDGIVIVTSPQDLVSMIVSKAVKMANMMHIPVLGFVENYSYLQCPDCGKKIQVFGQSKLPEVAEAFNLPILARLPIDPKVAEAYDSGLMETVDTEAMADVVAAVERT